LARIPGTPYLIQKKKKSKRFLFLAIDSRKEKPYKMYMTTNQITYTVVVVVTS